MNSNTKSIGIGLLIGGGIAAIVMTGAFFAGFLPMRSALVPASEIAPPPEEPASISFVLDATLTPTSTPTFTPAFAPTNIIAMYPMPVASPTPDEKSLAGQINQTLPTYGGDWNILIRADGEHTVFSLNADQSVHIASIFKVPLAMLFFRSLEENGIQPSGYAEYLSTRGIGRTYMQLLKAMLVESEEAATQTIRNIVADSKLDTNAALQSWGAFHTDMSSRHSTPEDIAALYESLYYGRAITPEGRQIILDLMSAYTPNDDTRLGVLRALLPADGKFYNKRGSVTTGRLIIGDAALLTWNQNGNEKVYVVVILSYLGTLPTSDVKLVQGIEAIARLFWDFVVPKNP